MEVNWKIAAKYFPFYLNLLNHQIPKLDPAAGIEYVGYLGLNVELLRLAWYCPGPGMCILDLSSHSTLLPIPKENPFKRALL